MPAYVIAEAELTGDPQKVATYSAKLIATIEPHGGRYLVRGAPWQVLEGESKAFTGVIEFPTAEAAQQWYQSPAYQEIVPLRARNTRGRIMIFEGVAAA
ncbi:MULTISPECIES: DUF1330 domain-containing protein [unclassified Streptomyces]|uniref:DUF1330 domain-containing protein n=1 Tax=unclassified Streptomyces TaxID=2593676 RepID=UPI002E36C325|nr:DUF1330 domain-containing protein [Streptomyces sp. NBC_01356]WTB44086.1 DUF1330 domain-containing protein [Streptomyces sp. NBC_00827]